MSASSKSPSSLVSTAAQLKKILLRQRGWQQDELEGKWDWEQLEPKVVGISIRELKKATTSLLTAKEHHQKILLFGDYDVDGHAATAILWLGLKELGIKATPFIPHRLKHGYGMSVPTLQEIFATNKPDLIITSDNGISAREALAYCQEQQVGVIVTDHHQRQDEKIPVVAVIHTQQLSGAGVAWYFMWWVLHQVDPARATPVAQGLLDLLVLATIVDQVPQVGVNRCLCRQGLLRLRQSQRAGLKALATSAKLDLTKATGRDLGFGLGPRINAIGRLTGTLDALRLLCTNSETLAYRLAQVLDSVNQQRQELTGEMLSLALAQVDSDNLPSLIVVAHEQFHEGIIGLLASQLVDRFERPAVVIAVGERVCKGSCRSVGEFDVTAYLGEFADQLLDYGGHALAAGFSVASDKLELISKQLTAGARAHHDQITAVKPMTAIPASLALLSDSKLPDLIDLLEPIGAGNEEIVVEVGGKVGQIQLLGALKNHAKIILLDERGVKVETLWWQYLKRGLDLPTLNQQVMITGVLRVNTFRSRTSVNLIGEKWIATKA